MPNWRVFVIRASDGAPIEELPARDVTFTEAINEDSSFTCTLPTWERQARRSLIDPQRGREIAVVRDPDKATARCVFNGPIVSTRRTMGNGEVSVTARSPFFYLARTFTEAERNYNADPFDIVRDLVNMVTAKEPLYRHDYDTWASGYGPTVYAFSAAEQRNIGKTIQDLGDDEGKPFDFRYDYFWQSAGHLVSRKLRLKTSLGTDKSAQFVLEPRSGLIDASETAEVLRAAGRVHVHGSGDGATQKRASRSTTIPTGIRRLEYLADHGDIDNPDVLFGIAGNYLRTLRAPVRVITATFRPSVALGYDFFNLGDSIRVTAPLGYESFDDVRRIVAMTTRFDEDGDELVDLVFNDPAASAGAV